MLIDPKEAATVATAAAAAAPRREKLRLGDVLVQQQLISQEQLQQALELQRGTGKRLGRLLIEAINNHSTLLVYPNPASSYINIRTTDNAAIELYNAVGQFMLRTYSHQIDVSQLSRGMYYIKCGQAVSKVVLK